jgi:hypothetical protein
VLGLEDQRSARKNARRVADACGADSRGFRCLKPLVADAPPRVRLFAVRATGPPA